MLIASSHLGLMGGKKFPVVEGITKSFTNAGSSFTATFPSGVEVGDLLVIQTNIISDANLTFTLPTGWTRVHPKRELGFISEYDVIYKVADGTEGSSVTLSYNSAGAHTHVCFRISGASGVIEGSSATTSGSLVNPPSHTASWGADKNLWLALGLGHSSSFSFTAAPTGYEDNFDQVAADYNGNSWSRSTWGTREYEDTATQDPSTFTGTLGGNYQWCASTIVIQPA